jgi:hypothetical protein
MKKYIVPLMFFTASLGLSSPLMAMGTLRHLFGLDKNRERTTPTVSRSAPVVSPASAEPRERLDIVNFWNTVIKALAREGYPDDSPYVRHAYKNLHRAETRRAKAGLLGLSKAQRVRSRKAYTTKPEEKRTTKERKATTYPKRSYTSKKGRTYAKKKSAS